MSAAARIEWSVSEAGLDAFERAMDHALRESVDMREPLTDVRDHVQEMIRDEFLSDGERSGGWAPLNHHYDLWKIERGQYEMLKLEPEWLHGNPGTPYETEMYNVLLADESWDITMDDAIFSPDSSRAAWHQGGALYRRRGGSLPARPVLFFLETDYDDIAELFERWMELDVLS